jgi:hypothetical protein
MEESGQQRNHGDDTGRGYFEKEAVHTGQARAITHHEVQCEGFAIRPKSY